MPTPTRQSGPRLLRLFVPCALWCLLLAAGFWRLEAYRHSPGEAGPAAGHWPRDTRLPPPAGKPVLLLFAHPRCPCTRASLEEFGLILERAGGAVDARVLFFRPASEAVPWGETELSRRAASLPGVSAGWDDDGREARRFGARTSGHVFLYGPDGGLLFSGGVTPSRGHRGPGPGSAALLALLRREAPSRTRADVFGCPLSESMPLPEECDSCR